MADPVPAPATPADGAGWAAPHPVAGIGRPHVRNRGSIARDPELPDGSPCMGRVSQVTTDPARRDRRGGCWHRRPGLLDRVPVEHPEPTSVRARHVPLRPRAHDAPVCGGFASAARGLALGAPPEGTGVSGHPDRGFVDHAADVGPRDHCWRLVQHAITDGDRVANPAGHRHCIPHPSPRHLGSSMDAGGGHVRTVDCGLCGVLERVAPVPTHLHGLARRSERLCRAGRHAAHPVSTGLAVDESADVHPVVPRLCHDGRAESAEGRISAVRRIRAHAVAAPCRVRPGLRGREPRCRALRALSGV